MATALMSPALVRSRTGQPMAGAARAVRGSLPGGFYVACSSILWYQLWLLVVTAVLAISGLAPVVITGTSMKPGLTRGDVVFIDRDARWEDLVPGQVLTYRKAGREDELVTHRIRYFEQDRAARTQGDYNRIVDSEPVVPGQLYGTPELIALGAGIPVIWAQDRDLVRLALWMIVGVIAATVALRPAPARWVSAKIASSRRESTCRVSHASALAQLGPVERVMYLAENDPDEVVRVLRRWLAEPGGLSPDDPGRPDPQGQVRE